MNECANQCAARHEGTELHVQFRRESDSSRGRMARYQPKQYGRNNREQLKTEDEA